MARGRVQSIHGIHRREQDRLRIYRLHPDRLAGCGAVAATQNGPTKRIERLRDAPAAPARRERTAVTVLLGYVALWTLYGTLAKGSQDLNSDMSEQYVLSRELAWGYPKHPPLAMAVVRAWFTVFPTAEWAYYLLAVATAGLALWITWRLSARFLDGEKTVVGRPFLSPVALLIVH